MSNEILTEKEKAITFARSSGNLGMRKSTPRATQELSRSSILEEERELQAYERGKFANSFQYLCTCVSYAIGFSNIWRFPYLCYKNGGGAFLVPYTISLFIAGLPMMFLEMGLGQFSSQGPITVWRLSPMFEGIGWGQIFVSFYVTLFYAVLSGYSLLYLVMSLRAHLLWSGCGYWWNDSQKCRTAGVNGTFFRSAVELPAEGFWYKWMLHDSGTLEDYGILVWKPLLAIMFCWIVCSATLSRGVKSMGNAMYFIALYPYVAVTILVVKGMTLPGAAEGIMFYILPNWGRLLDITVWSDAATQIFFSLGICQGSLLTMSSFNNFHDNVLRNATVVSIINCATSFYLGFGVFTIVSYLSHEYNISLDHIVASGSSLVFILYPTGLSLLDVSPLWSAIWFLMMVIVGVGSMIGCFETVLAPLSDRFETLQKHQLKFRLSACFVGFLTCIPMIFNGGFHLLDVVNTYAGGVNLLFLAICELIAVGYVYGGERLLEDMYMMMQRKISRCWVIMWKYVTLLYISFISILWIVNYANSSGTPHEPVWASTLGWLISFSTVLPLVVFALYVWGKMSHINEHIYVSTKPLPRWGPVLPENRVGRYAEKQKELDDEALYESVATKAAKKDRFKWTHVRRESRGATEGGSIISMNPQTSNHLPSIKRNGLGVNGNYLYAT